MIPDWLARHLEDTGKLGPDRIGRAARASHCKKCGQWILTGLDNDMCAAVANADPTPLTALGEALAHIADRNTYALRATTGRLELQLRDSWQIAGSPAGTTHYDVVAAHQCGDAVNLPTIPSVLATATSATPEHPPF